MAQYCEVSGTVRGAQGVLAGAVVSIERAVIDNARDTTYETQVTTDSNGAFSFTVPQGARIRFASDDVSGIDQWPYLVPRDVSARLGVFFADAANEVSAREVSGAGAVSGTGVTVTEYGNEAMRKTVIHFKNAPFSVANTTGASFGAQKIYDFPLGRIQVLGGRSNLSFDWSASDIVDSGSGDFSLGTTATADATLGGTDVDIMASTAMLDPFVSGVGTGKGNLVKTTEFDGTSAAKDCYLNIIIDDADVEDAATAEILITGDITIVWVNEGV